MLRMMLMFMAFLLGPVALAGEFTLKTEDSSGLWYEYTGTVEDWDADTLREIMISADGRRVFVTINSGGGSAYGGLGLFWEAERWANLVTIAGKDYGAWSAAAMFWLGSPQDWFESKDSKVGFHQAYCNWMHPPGCDLTHFRARLREAFDKAGYYGQIFDTWLTQIQATWGVGGWALLTDEGWRFYHSNLEITYKIDPIWEI